MARLWLVLWLIAGAGAQTATCLAVPFENRSSQSGLDWIGESFVLSLREGLASDGIHVLTQAERDQARTLVGAPAGVPLSHATLMRMGGAADAAWMVTGWYDYDGTEFTTAAALFDLKHEHLIEIAEQRGALADLEDIQGRLSWAVLKQESGGAAEPPAEADAAAIPLAAYENLVRAQLAPAGSMRRAYLETAYHLAPKDARVALALGQAAAAGGDNLRAANVLLQVAARTAQYPEAQFDAALAEYRLGNFEKAASILQELSHRLPLPAVEDDLELAQAGARHQPSTQPLETDFPVAAFRQLEQISGSTGAASAGLTPQARALENLRQGERLEAAGALEAAAQAFQAVLAVSPVPDAASIAAAHAGLGEIWYARHDAVRAAQEARAALAADSTNQQAKALLRKLRVAGGPA